MDDDKLALYALRVWGYKQGEVVALMIHLGNRLGLYAAMDRAGPLTADDLAARTGLDRRWLLEWLRCQAAAELVESSDGEVFELGEEGAEVLVNETGSIRYAAGAFTGAAASADVADRLLEAFRTGRGLTYDELGPAGADAIERMTAPGTRLVLVPRVLPALDGVVAKLLKGGDVADVGCGGGLALVAMAAAYPASRIVGYDPSANALALAQAKLDGSGLDNVTLRQVGAAELPTSPTYDLVLTLDCIHDLPDPLGAVSAIRRAIKPDGTLLMKDIRSASSWTDNLRNPMLAMMYGTSVTTCLSSGLSEPGGAGLGTLGLHPDLAEQLTREAGFGRFSVHDFDDPVNLYYEVRP